MMASMNNYFSGLVLILAGIYQLTPYKNACLDKCRSPLSLVMSKWKDGNFVQLKVMPEKGETLESFNKRKQFIKFPFCPCSY